MSSDSDLSQNTSQFAQVPQANQDAARTDTMPTVTGRLAAFARQGDGKSGQVDDLSDLENPLTTTQAELVASQSAYRLLAIPRPEVTQALLGVHAPQQTTARMPIVIKSAKKKPVPVQHPRGWKRRLVFSILASLFLLMISGGTLFAVSSLDRDGGLSFNPFAGSSSFIQNRQSSLNNLAVQATATAVFHQTTDGYDPNAGSVPVVTTSSGSLNWPVGQCTYWANLRYHELTGYWVPWSGNADQWVAGAEMANWKVSTMPHIPSIIVLMPGVEGASSAYGHVAVAEKLLSSTEVEATTMNWYAGGGGFDIESTWDYTTASGVYFVWHP
jgi:surface antigen